MTGCVLVVDDDTALSEMLGIVLRGEGFEPVFAATGEQALTKAAEANPDVVLLDLMLPGTDGVEVCREIRTKSDVPIVVLTAKTDTVDVVRGLESGADDYVVKPFKPKELVARIRARLRRSDDATPQALHVGDLAIDVPGHTVRRVATVRGADEGGPTDQGGADEGIEAWEARAGGVIPLTPLEFDLLVCLARKPRQVFTREQLLQQVWGYRHAADTRLVNVHVQRLRSKIEKDPENPKIVVTVRGVGYRAGSG